MVHTVTNNNQLIQCDCSVVIPCYNATNTLRACVKSIVDQTVRPIEIIAIDDGSKDATLDLLYTLQKEYQDDVRMKVIHQENAGPSKARNEGIRVATGKWIAFLDSDDAWHPQALAVAMWCHQQSEDVVLVSGKSANLYPLTKPQYTLDSLSTQRVSYRELLFKNAFTTSCVVCKTEVLAEFLFDETQKYSEDYKLWLDICYNYSVCRTDVITSYTINGERGFGASGLSSRMYDMWLGEIRNYKYQYQLKRISYPKLLLLAAFSFLKLLRRYIRGYKRLLFNSKFSK